MEVSSVLEEGEETHTHTSPVRRGNEPAMGQQSLHEATTHEVAAPTPSLDAVAALQRQVEVLSARVVGQTMRGTNKVLAGLAHFSPDMRGAIMLAGLKLPGFTTFTGKTDPEEHITEFQSQMSFHQPDSKSPQLLARPVAGDVLWLYLAISESEAGLLRQPDDEGCGDQVSLRGKAGLCLNCDGQEVEAVF
ncbi:hypothetical protein LIER_26292 [Lithospermum erythrorhizon]|uniref:Uncharacterized protein n=1 Tax=Lithospermum erythrorhizon TaxID=34254 RepID=A0AAV3R9D2_LITER